MILETYNFTLRGKEIAITIEENPHIFKVSFMNDGLIEDIVFKSMVPNFISKTIHCEYFVKRTNPISGKVENSRTGVFTVTPDEFDMFFNSPTGAMPMGIFLARNFVNGMTFEEKSTLGVRFFNSMLQPTQPVTADTVTVNASEGLSDGSITVNVVDGVAPLTYSLNESEPQTENVFENLSSGEYSVKAIDSNGTYFAIQIVI